MGREGESELTILQAGGTLQKNELWSCRFVTQFCPRYWTCSGGSSEHPTEGEKPRAWPEAQDTVSLKDGKENCQHCLDRRRGQLCPLKDLDRAGLALFWYLVAHGKKVGQSAFPQPPLCICQHLLKMEDTSVVGLSSTRRPHCTGGSWRCWVFWCRLRMALWLKLRPQAGQW